MGSYTHGTVQVRSSIGQQPRRQHPVQYQDVAGQMVPHGASPVGGVPKGPKRAETLPKASQKGFTQSMIPSVQCICISTVEGAEGGRWNLFYLGQWRGSMPFRNSIDTLGRTGCPLLSGWRWRWRCPGLRPGRIPTPCAVCHSWEIHDAHYVRPWTAI